VNEDIDVNFVPDAYYVDTVSQIMTIIEVVHSHDITDDKMNQIAKLWFDLDYYNWELALSIVSKHGSLQIDLMGKYYDMLRKGEK